MGERKGENGKGGERAKGESGRFFTPEQKNEEEATS